MEKTAAKIVLKLFGVSLIALIIVMVLFYLMGHRELVAGILSGYVFSLVLFLLGFLSFNWAMTKPLKTLMGVVLGGMFFRFLLLGGAIFIILKYTDINVLHFVISFFFFYLIYQYIEIRFVSATISKGKK